MKNYVIRVHEVKAKEFIALLTKRQLIDNIVSILRRENDPIIEYTMELDDKDKSLIEYKFI